MMFGEHPLEKQFVLKELRLNCGVVNYLQLDGYYKIAANFFHFKFYSVYLYSVLRFQASYMHIFLTIFKLTVYEKNLAPFLRPVYFIFINLHALSSIIFLRRRQDAY